MAKMPPHFIACPLTHEPERKSKLSGGRETNIQTRKNVTQSTRRGAMGNSTNNLIAYGARLQLIFQLFLGLYTRKTSSCVRLRGSIFKYEPHVPRLPTRRARGRRQNEKIIIIHFGKFSNLFFPGRSREIQ